MQIVFLILDFIVAAAVTGLSNWVALRVFRRLGNVHWTERARRMWPARTAAALLPWLLPADIVLAQRLAGFPGVPPWPLAALAAWAGAIAANYRFDREFFPWLTPRAWRHQVMAGWTIRFALWTLFFATVALMPRDFDWRAWALGGCYVTLFGLWLLGGLLLACRILKLVRPAPERLLGIVAAVSQRMKVPVSRVWLLPSSAASAFALPLTRELLFSERLLNLHPDDEVAAICAHELGHLGESRAMLAARIGGSLFLVPLLFIKPVAFTWGPAALLVIGAISWLLIYGSRRLSHRLEQRADKIAQANELDSGTYARALARLHEENLVPAVMPRRRTHPDLYDRLLAAGVQPDYPRPAKPAVMAPQVLLLSMLLGVLIVAKFQSADRRVWQDPHGPEPPAEMEPTQP